MMSLKPTMRVLLYLSTIIVLSQLLLLIEYHHESRNLLQRLDFTSVAASWGYPNKASFQSSHHYHQAPARKHSEFAYAFVMAGVDPDHPHGYRGILFSILVVTQILETSGSQADVVVLAQMSHKSKTNVIPEEDLTYLKAYPNIVVEYLPKPVEAPSFYSAQFDKFHVLELTQYRRILYLDADVMPLCNLDYLFHFADQGILKDNMLLAGNNEPSNGGFMMVRPGKGEYEQLSDIIYQRDGRILASPNLTFDEVVGWGHVIQAPDYWRTRYYRQTGLFWNFTTAYGNQGLMYYWAKYYKKSASLFAGFEVENWSVNETDGSPMLEKRLYDVLKGHECPNRLEFPHDKYTIPPYDLEGQMWHFDGKEAKPWMVSNLTGILSGNLPRHRPYQMWFKVFDQVQRRLNINLDVEKDLRHDPALGSWTTPKDFKRSMQKKHAYAFVMAGVDPERPRGYRGILFSILVVAQILENTGSTADIVVLVQMSYESKAHVIPDEDLAYLQKYPKIVIHYLPKPLGAPSFYSAQFDKFHVLELTQYRRILYLDADVMPLCNLDYLFRLSESGVLKENMLLAGNNEPSNGGFMMVRPGKGEYEQLLDIIYQRDGRILSSPNLTFDEVVGWGHVIQAPDYWRTRYYRQTGLLWNFTTAYGNQGLMYYWAKYYKKSASLFAGFEVENWSVNETDGSPMLEGRLYDVLKGYECPARLEVPYDKYTIPPYDMEGQIWHFGGKEAKPWMVSNLTGILSGNETAHRPYQMWFQVFDQVQDRLNIKLDIQSDLRHDPALGSWTTPGDFTKSLQRKHAYAFVMAGVDPEHPDWYRGIFFSILVVAEILESSGSAADIVLMVEMAPISKSDFLSDEDMAYLKSYPNVVVYYLPKPSKVPSMYESQLLKFHILELTQYRRVLYLGADVMPLCSLDYLFFLSERGILKENMVLALNNEPANTGFMILRPGAGEFQQFLKVIENRNASVWGPDSVVKFDEVSGWGHTIEAPDRWRTRYDRQTGTYWNFSAAAEDQGLLYHWVKYVKKNVSLFIGNEVENWSSQHDSSIPVLESTSVNVIQGHECPVRIKFPRDKFAQPPYDLEGQIWHFWSAKPWTLSNLEEISILTSKTTENVPFQMWFQMLDRVKQRLKVKTNVQQQ